MKLARKEIEVSAEGQSIESEKSNKTVKKMFWGLIIAAIATYTFFVVLAIIVGIICGLIGGENIDYMSDLLLHLVMAGTNMAVSIVFCKVIRKQTFKEFREEKIHLKKLIPFAIIVIGCLSTLVFLGKAGSDLMITNIIQVLVVAPIFEELMFRGVVQRILKPYCGELFAVLITTVVFVLFHMSTAQIVVPLIIGLLAGYFASRYSIKGAIIIHFLANLQSFIYSINSEVIEGIMSITVIGTIVVLIIKLKKIIMFFIQKPEKGMLKNVIFSLPLLLFIGVCVVGMIVSNC